MSYCSKYPPRLSSTLVANVHVGYLGQVTTYPATASEVLQQRWYSSVKTANFVGLSRRQLPVNSFLAGSYVITDRGGSARKWGGSSYQYWNGSAQTMFPAMYSGIIASGHHNYDDTQVAIRAEQHALSKCANMKMNVAQSFAERKQTANLLISSVNRFVTVAMLLRKGKFSEVNRALGKRRQLFSGKRFEKDAVRPPTQKDFSNLWLEYSYGWRPLLADVYGAAELLAQTATKSRPLSARGTYKNLETLKSRYTSFGVTSECITQREQSGLCRFEFDITDQLADVLKSTGISNPALLAWELLPYSFVVDWFIPVGNYLENWNAASGLKFVRGHTTVRTRSTSVCKHVGNTQGYEFLSGYECYATVARINRSKLSTFPSARFPTFSLDLNLSQVTSGLALLHQIFDRRKG